MSWIEVSVCALEILPSGNHTFTPPHRHVVDGLLEHRTWETTQDLPDFSLKNLHCGKFPVSEFGFDCREGPEIARREVRTIGRMTEEGDALLSIVGNGWN